MKKWVKNSFVRLRRDARVVEEARLESVYTPKAYRGFESPSLRKEGHKHKIEERIIK